MSKPSLKTEIHLLSLCCELQIMCEPPLLEAALSTTKVAVRALNISPTLIYVSAAFCPCLTVRDMDRVLWHPTRCRLIQTMYGSYLRCFKAEPASSATCGRGLKVAERKQHADTRTLACRARACVCVGGNRLSRHHGRRLLCIHSGNDSASAVETCGSVS